MKIKYKFTRRIRTFYLGLNILEVRRSSQCVALMKPCLLSRYGGFTNILPLFLAKCLKAKYFTHTNVIQTRLGYKPSFVWNSIYHTIWIIQKARC